MLNTCGITNKVGVRRPEKLELQLNWLFWPTLVMNQAHLQIKTFFRCVSQISTSDPDTNFYFCSQAAAASNNGSTDFIQNLCSIADHRLYKIVKWCKSLPLFKYISVRHFSSNHRNPC